MAGRQRRIRERLRGGRAWRVVLGKALGTVGRARRTRERIRGGQAERGVSENEVA